MSEIVIIDCGSSSTKVGFAGQDKPELLIPTVVGRETLNEKQKVYVGQKALDKKDLNLSYPIQYGCINNWEDMERVWKSSFKKLKLDSKGSSVVLTEVLGNPKEMRESMTSLFFEKFETANLYVGSQPVYGLYASGKTSGLVVDLGHQLSYCVPIHEGVCQSSIQILPVTGEKIDDYLKSLFEKDSITLNTTTIQDIKHNLCYVAEDFDTELSKIEDLTKTYTLPDGKEIKVSLERILGPELFFQEKISKFEPIQNLTRKLIKKCVNNTKLNSSLFYQNIVFIGGSSEFKGIQKRMQKEMELLVPKKKVQVVAPLRRRFSSWVGCSLLGASNTFDSLWVTKQDYQEFGSAIIHQKCPK